MNKTSRFTKLLGECRRQMNGAVAGSMRYYGERYGLNYGVSLPTIRQLSADEGRDHSFACYLYQQQVREIRLASYHIAQPEMINIEDLPFWAEGLINSELAEEASFALFQHVDAVTFWLDSDNELLQYTAILSIAKSRRVEFQKIAPKIITLSSNESILLRSAIVTLLESYYQIDNNRLLIRDILTQLPKGKTSEFIISEMDWRCEIG